MTNSSSVSRFAALAAAATASAALAVLAVASGASLYLVAPACLAALGALAWLLRAQPGASGNGVIERALAVCKRVSAGDFEARITGIEDAGQFGELLWAINT